MGILKEFKKDFKLVCTDKWGESMGSWFDVANVLLSRGIKAPGHWQFKPSPLGFDLDDDSYWVPIFKEYSDDDLITIGNFLERYTKMLRYNGLDY
jgi:hypothetical protein